MITYIYWLVMAAFAIGAFYLIGFKLKQWIGGSIVTGVILLLFSSFYYFYFEQMFVKRWGGTMSLKVPPGQHHVAATWKDDNLWIENYDPATNTCIFQEYSRGNVLEGKVVIKNCNPITAR